MTNPKNISKIKETKKLPEIEWNDKNITAYTDLDLEVPDTVGRFEKRFLSQVDVTKGPIERTVTHMVRLRAPDYLANDKVPQRKEWIYYQERWEAKSWKGIPIMPVDGHIEGYYDKQFTKPHFNQENGDIDYYELDVGKVQTIYYIPFSKKTVDDIIAKSAHSDKHTIKFTIKFASEDCPWGPRPPTRNQFSYEQFTNWKWEDIYKLHVKPQEVLAHELQSKDKSAYNLQFEPT